MAEENRRAETETSGAVHDDEPSFGLRIKSLRKSHSLSLKELAEKAGVSVGALSQIERDITSPSVRTLNKLATAFGVPASVFFASNESGGEIDGIIVRKGFGAELQVKSQGIRKKLLTPQNLKGLQLMRVMMEPNSSSGSEAYGHPGMDAGYVVHGALKLEVNGRIYVLSAGDSFGFPSTLPHRFECLGNHPAEVVWVNTR